MARVSCTQSATLLMLAALGMSMMVSTPVRAQGPDPKATRILKRSLDFLAGLERFAAQTDNTLEAVLSSGQKIQFDTSVSLIVQRPDKLRAQRGGAQREQLFYYDGKTLTLYNPSQDVYASVAAPDTLEKMMDFARSSLDIFVPAGDLLYRDAYRRLMQGVTGGLVVGKATISGVVCDQLAFSGPEVDWQIWVQKGDTPLPRKYVVTTKSVEGWPEYSVTIAYWDIDPTLRPEQFSFVVPAGAKKIAFLPLAASRTPR